MNSCFSFRSARLALHPGGDLYVHGETAPVYFFGRDAGETALRHPLPRGPTQRLRRLDNRIFPPHVPQTSPSPVTPFLPSSPSSWTFLWDRPYALLHRQATKLILLHFQWQCFVYPCFLLQFTQIIHFIILICFALFFLVIVFYFFILFFQGNSGKIFWIGTDTEFEDDAEVNQLWDFLFTFSSPFL